jgi:hypothetical protein
MFPQPMLYASVTMKFFSVTIFFTVTITLCYSNHYYMLLYQLHYVSATNALRRCNH